MNQHARIQWDLAMIEAQSLKLGYSWLKQQPPTRSSFTQALNEAINDAKQRGGRREGSGRKALDGVGTINTTVRLTPEQQLHFANLGGSKWLRTYLDNYIQSNRKPK